jgi:multidrug efflux pump
MSQVLTLYTTPVVYVVLDRLRQRMRVWFKVKNGSSARPSSATSY